MVTREKMSTWFLNYISPERHTPRVMGHTFFPGVKAQSFVQTSITGHTLLCSWSLWSSSEVANALSTSATQWCTFWTIGCELSHIIDCFNIYKILAREKSSKNLFQIPKHAPWLRVRLSCSRISPRLPHNKAFPIPVQKQEVQKKLSKPFWTLKFQFQIRRLF